LQVIEPVFTHTQLTCPFEEWSAQKVYQRVEAGQMYNLSAIDEILCLKKTLISYLLFLQNNI
jgi:hypothetical protein